VLIDVTTGRSPGDRPVPTGATRFAGNFLLLFGLSAVSTAAPAVDLFERSIEELGQLRVVTVSRRSEPVRDAPSAIFVITSEEIRRSGYTTLPEILRLAPGVEVARNGAHSWTISIRGFNSDLSNKLLVLIDGRSVYSPLFAGVFWDAQDTFIPDIERIEVISGPGSTLWGANAVNGVINIITKEAQQTRGLLVDAGGGDEERAFGGLRYGWDVSEDIAARVYIKYADRDASALPEGGDAFDGWQTARAGFRMDWEMNESDEFKIEGDVYDAELSDLVRGNFTLGTLPGPDSPGHIDIAGYNLLARWMRRTETGSSRLQVYFDNTDRDIPGSFNERRDTFDLDFQYGFRAGNHEIVWGAGYRLTSDDLDNTLFATFLPEERTDETIRLFIQDEVGLWSENLLLTVGLDVNHNDYTDFEWHPNVRLTWAVNDRHSLWTAVTRAVRVPARLNTDLVLTAPFEVPGLGIPLYFNVTGSDDYRSEELLAKELGYRSLLSDRLSVDVAVFHNDYDRLQTQELGPAMVIGDPPEYLVLPARLANGMKGETWGGTVVATWQALADWRVQFQYAYLDFDLHLKEGSTDENAPDIAGNSPKQQAAVYSFLELPANLELFAGVRYVDQLPTQAVSDHVALDVSLGWRVSDDLRLSMTVRNLNDGTHAEFGGGNLIERSAYLRATWSPSAP
jgi:iron complex outermembrane receptor protein